MSLAKLFTAEQTIESALVDEGWREESAGHWDLDTPHGPATLTRRPQRTDWRYFHLVGGAVEVPDGRRVLHENLHLFGPAKFVASRRGGPVCRLDVPLQLTGSTRKFESTDDWMMDFEPQQAWAQAVTACAAGREVQSPEKILSGEFIVDQIRKAGWSASLDDDEVFVHMQLPGIFRQLQIEHYEPAGVKLATDLVELDGYSGESIRAVMRLAGEANSRLPLVRLAIDEDNQPRVLRAEVHLGTSLIPGAWLTSSLETIEAAIALVSRELEALRDPELAKLVLAAAA